MKKPLLLKLFILTACLWCAIDAAAAAAYACYTPSNTTLTFYYDDLRYSRTGTTFGLNIDSDSPNWSSSTIRSSVTKVVFNSSFADARPTSTYLWFYGMSKITSITGINYLNTSQVTNMSGMFWDCINLTSLDLSNFNTTNVTTMFRMFDSCSSLTSLDLSSFNNTNVTTMYGMFNGCSSLTSLNLSGFNTSNVTTMNSMFRRCSSLTSLDVSGFNTAKVNDMNRMFAECSGLRSLDLSNFNTSNVTDMGEMFNGCIRMNSLNLRNFNTAKVTNMQIMFAGCSSLTSLNLSSFNTSNVTSTKEMFDGCSSLTSLDLSSFNTSQVTIMNEMFNGCTNLTTIYASDLWSTAAVTTSASMFTDCTSLVGGMGTTYSVYHVDKFWARIDGGPFDPGYFTAGGSSEAYACYTPSNTTLTFYYDNQRSSRSGTVYDLPVDGNYPDWLLDGTYASITRVVFNSSFAQATPYNTRNWFFGMQNLLSITGMKQYLNTSEVTDMSNMFSLCQKLTSIDLSNFNTAKVTNMNSMFSYCEALTNLDVSSFNTDNVTNMNGMFGACSGLTSLDLSSFNTDNVTNMNVMFSLCSNLRTIYVGNGWSTESVTAESGYMFNNCTSLVGGMGTAFDASHTDKAYAHIDGGPSDPGYFTDKNAGPCGDVNGDGSVNITDVTALIDLLLSGAVPPAVADCNADGEINITDVTTLIDYLLSGSW